MADTCDSRPVIDVVWCALLNMILPTRLMATAVTLIIYCPDFHVQRAGLIAAACRLWNILQHIARYYH